MTKELKDFLSHAVPVFSARPFRDVCLVIIQLIFVFLLPLLIHTFNVVKIYGTKTVKIKSLEMIFIVASVWGRVDVFSVASVSAVKNGARSKVDFRSVAISNFFPHARSAVARLQRTKWHRKIRCLLSLQRLLPADDDDATFASGSDTEKISTLLWKNINKILIKTLQSVASGLLEELITSRCYWYFSLTDSSNFKI